MDEQRVREIVREELADIRKEAAATTTADENLTIHGHVTLSGVAHTSIQHVSTSDKTKHVQA